MKTLISKQNRTRLRSTNDRVVVARQRARTRGISLLEVTIALTILAFGLLAGASAQLSAMSFSNQSRARTEAQYLAQQQMEILQANSSATVGAFPDATVVADPTNPIDPDPLDTTVRQYNRSWTVTRDTPVAGVFQVNVQVSWTGRSGTVRSITLESLKSEF
jgi:Tfp pilus assembly protein PilV